MKPKLWGNQFWFTIHTIALTYPENPSSDEKESALQFMISLKDLLPCEKCKLHYKKNINLQKLKKAIESQESLFKYTVDLHNMVNTMNGEKELTIIEAKERLKNKFIQPSKCGQFWPVIILTTALLYWIWYKT